MPFEPIAPRSVPEDVYEQIVEGVLSGDLRAGETLPSERELAKVLGVSRPAVREALRRVAGAGLVSIRQGQGTRVLDPVAAGGLDLLPRLLVRNGQLVPGVVRSIVEARALIGPKVAELAAQRAGDDEVEALRACVEELAAESDPVAQQVVALEFWSRVIDASDSITFRLMYNSLRAAYEPALPALAAVLEPEVGNVTGYRAVVDAIAGRRSSDADVAARALLAPATAALLELCEALVESSGTSDTQP
ncbi:FadR/GntR family transcriptional regulator [Gordonia sp. SL306]|uniref:FadR/GntR family transcriptional regulator n=1 Tax=Gordonia sp. SL306 TaxID=2995145 RepID=UPI002272222C|nr:FadR/GntR family transcriptional regulator [Gordonia sp. SL306]WAC53681.1 FadR/GntR family transcriptional regulator [Gordonia sp. SL306]